MPETAYEWVRPPWWRRWLARLLALVALAGVAYAVVTIVREGTDESVTGPPPLERELKALARAQATLGGRLEDLRPGASGRRVRTALKRTRAAQSAAVGALRKARALENERALQDALGAEFDYLDAVGSVLTDRRSLLLKDLGNRAETAKEAFTALEDSQKVEDGIRGTTALVTWARARR